jgi:transcriptional regulator with XRE-family HTH domain
MNWLQKKIEFMNRSEVARASNIKPITLQKIIERNTNLDNISISTFIKLAKALKIDNIESFILNNVTEQLKKELEEIEKTRV